LFKGVPYPTGVERRLLPLTFARLSFVRPAEQVLPREGFMMTSVPRYAPALCAAVVLFLLAGTLRAGGDPAQTIEVSGSHAQDNQGPPDNEIVAINVYVPKTSAAFETSASLLFLQPGSGNLMYGTLVNPFPFLSPHWSDQSVRPEFSPTFNVGMRYVFDGGGAVRLDWTHLNTYDRASAQVTTPYELGLLAGPPSIQALGPPFLIGPPVPYASALAVAHFDYDAINLEAELLLGVGSHVQVRTFAGLQGARISESLSAAFRSADGSLSFTDVSKSSFTGVGPRLGMELHYLTGNLDLLGGIAGSTLIGTRQSRIDFFANSPANALAGLTPNVQSLTSPDSTQVIPCIDAKLAASYTTPLGSFGIFKCEAGYQATVYINAVNQYSLTEVENSLTADQPKTPETTGSAVFLRSAVEYQSNFLVHGPFVKLSLQF
jgi:hypothetical protein